MTINDMNNTHRGQSLLEIVVATAVAILLITGLLVATSVSLRTSQNGQQRSKALKYAQEGIELTRSLRDSLDWASFTAYDPNAGSASTTWCLVAAGNWKQGACDPVVDAIDGVYTRAVTFEWNDRDSDPNKYRMEVTVTVSWDQAGQTKSVTLATYFTQWK